MVCAGLETMTEFTITTLLQFPLSCDYFFYLKIYAALWVIFTLTLFYEERLRIGKSDFISSCGVSSIATIFMALIGTMIGIVTNDIFIIILVFGGVFIGIWFLKE